MRDVASSLVVLRARTARPAERDAPGSTPAANQLEMTVARGMWQASVVVLKGIRLVVADVTRRLGRHVSAALSQPYYLDVTHPRANKGEVVSVLSTLLAIPSTQIATIWDMPNDELMFQRSGVSIGMGNATSEVQHEARFVTTSNTEEGFALAMERYVLGARIA